MGATRSKNHKMSEPAFIDVYPFSIRLFFRSPHKCYKVRKLVAKLFRLPLSEVCLYRKDGQMLKGFDNMSCDTCVSMFPSNPYYYCELEDIIKDVRLAVENKKRPRYPVGCKGTKMFQLYEQKTPVKFLDHLLK